MHALMNASYIDCSLVSVNLFISTSSIIYCIIYNKLFVGNRKCVCYHSAHVYNNLLFVLKWTFLFVGIGRLFTIPVLSADTK